MKTLKVLSLFDGISCGRIAFERANINVEYYSSEIDKVAIAISQKNYKDIKQLGDVKNFNSWGLTDIDVLIGGSPCQDLSSTNSVGKGLNGEKSSLFYYFVSALHYYKPKYFLFENVASMKKEYIDIISKELNVKPIFINSNVVSAQNRRRLYWTNIPLYFELINKHILFKDILENHVFTPFKPWCFKSTKWGLRIKMLNNIYNEKSNPVTTQRVHSTMYLTDNNGLSLLTPVECERLQTLPENYTEGFSIGKRIKAIGNAWTVDVIKYFFENLKIDWSNKYGY